MKWRNLILLCFRKHKLSNLKKNKKTNKQTDTAVLKARCFKTSKKSWFIIFCLDLLLNLIYYIKTYFKFSATRCSNTTHFFPSIICESYYHVLSNRVSYFWIQLSNPMHSGPWCLFMLHVVGGGRQLSIRLATLKLRVWYQNSTRKSSFIWQNDKKMALTNTKSATYTTILHPKIQAQPGGKTDHFRLRRPFREIITICRQLYCFSQ